MSIKAIFIDYTGTMVQEDEPYTRELLTYFISHSDLKDPKEILKIVWGKVKEIEAESYGDSFVKIDESSGVHTKEAKGLHEVMDRAYKNKDYYKNNPMLKSTFDFLKMVVDSWFAHE